MSRCPGAKPATWVTNCVVIPGTTFDTTIFTTPTKPTLATLPVTTSVVPGTALVGGQYFVTTNAGRGSTLQLVDALAVTNVPHELMPHATTVSGTKQLV